MANNPDYRCSNCGKDENRNRLTVKKATFTEMGEGARVVRSRVVAWLCPSCVVDDPDYNREAFKSPTVVLRQMGKVKQ